MSDARKPFPPPHLIPRGVVPFEYELKVCQLTNLFQRTNKGLVLRWALSALHVGGRYI